MSRAIYWIDLELQQVPRQQLNLMIPQHVLLRELQVLRYQNRYLRMDQLESSRVKEPQVLAQAFLRLLFQRSHSSSFFINKADIFSITPAIRR